MTNKSVEITLKLGAEKFSRDAKLASTNFSKSIQSMRADGRKLRSAFDSLDTRSTLRINQEIKGLQKSYRKLATSGKVSLKDLARAKESLRQKTRALRRELKGTNNDYNRLGSSVAGVFSIGATVALTRQIIQTNEEYTQLIGRLRLVTDSEEELTKVTNDLFRTAQDTRSAFTVTADLYTKLARNADRLNLSQRELLLLTKGTNQAIQLSGAGTQEAAAGVLQFSQALASGELRGDELRSVLENMPRLAQAIADGLDTDIGGLRELAEQGKLTAGVVTNAVLSQVGVLDSEFQRLPKTVGQAFTQMSNVIQRAVGNIDADDLVDSIDHLTGTLSDPSTLAAIQTFGSVLIDTFTGALGVMKRLVTVSQSFGNRFGRLVAGPMADELSDIEDRIKNLRDDLDRPLSLTFFVGDDDLGTGFFSDDSIQAKIDELEAKRQEIIQAIGGSTAGDLKQDQQAASERKDILRDIAREESALRDQQLKLNEARDKQFIASSQEVMRQQLSNVREVLRAKQQALQAEIQAQRESIQKIRSLRQSIVDRERSTDELLTDRNRSRLSEADQQVDIEQEIAEKIRQAREQLKAGKTDDIERLANRIQSLAQKLKDVDKGDAAIQESARLYKDGKEKEIAAEKKAAIQRDASIKKQKDDINKVKAEADLLTNAIKAIGEEDPNIEITTNIDEIQAKIKALRKDLRELEDSVPASGGAGGGGIEGRRTGGPIGHFAAGGHLPGYGGGDRRLILAEDGEFMIRKEAVRKYGRGMFAALNAMQMNGFNTGGIIESRQRNLPFIQKMAKGGAVQPTSQQTEPTQTINLNLKIGGENHSLFGEADDVNRLINNLTEVSRGV